MKRDERFESSYQIYQHMNNGAFRTWRGGKKEKKNWINNSWIFPKFEEKCYSTDLRSLKKSKYYKQKLICIWAQYNQTVKH